MQELKAREIELRRLDKQAAKIARKRERLEAQLKAEQEDAAWYDQLLKDSGFKRPKDLVKAFMAHLGIRSVHLTGAKRGPGRPTGTTRVGRPPKAVTTGKVGRPRKTPKAAKTAKPAKASGSKASEDMKSHIEAAFDAYLRSDPDLPFGLTKHKIEDRACDFKVEGKQLSFTMMRHHPLSGSRYIRGCPMAAMIEREVVYTFDAESETLSESGQISAEVIINNLAQWAEEIVSDDWISVEAEEDGGFVVRCETWCLDERVESYDEAVDTVKGHVEALDFSQYFYECSDYLSGKEVESLEKKLIEACQEEQVDKLKSAWNEADCDCD